MLVLSRQRNETIMIGDEVEVTVIDIRGDKVRLGINAPREVTVHRKEVYEAIKRENQAAAQVQPDGSTGDGTAAVPAAAPADGQVRPAVRVIGPTKSVAPRQRRPRSESQPAEGSNGS